MPTFTTKEAALCVGGGLVIAVLIFIAAFFVAPTLLTNRAFVIIVGLLPMVIIAGLVARKKESQ